MLQLIVLGHKIRIRTGLYYDDLPEGICIHPLAVNADGHELSPIPFRHPPLVPISNGVIDVLVCPGPGIGCADIHAVPHPFFCEDLLPMETAPVQIKPCKPCIIPEGDA